MMLRSTENHRQLVPRCASQQRAGNIRIMQEGLEVPDFILGSNFVFPNPRYGSLRALVWPKSDDRKHLQT